MNDIDCSYDDLLCRSLSLFRQFRLYDDRIEEDNAFVFLREAEKVVSDTRNGVCVAKLGCVIECLSIGNPGCCLPRCKKLLLHH